MPRKPTKKTTTKKKSYPKYENMIADAISTLKERNGSSVVAINRYIQAEYGVPADTLRVQLRIALKRGIENEDLEKVKASYKLTPQGKVKRKSYLKSLDKTTRSRSVSPKRAAKKKTTTTSRGRKTTATSTSRGRKKTTSASRKKTTTTTSRGRKTTTSRSASAKKTTAAKKGAAKGKKKTTSRSRASPAKGKKKTTTTTTTTRSGRTSKKVVN